MNKNQFKDFLSKSHLKEMIPDLIIESKEDGTLRIGAATANMTVGVISTMKNANLDVHDFGIGGVKKLLQIVDGLMDDEFEISFEEKDNKQLAGINLSDKKLKFYFTATDLENINFTGKDKAKGKPVKDSVLDKLKNPSFSTKIEPEFIKMYSACKKPIELETVSIKTIDTDKIELLFGKTAHNSNTAKFETAAIVNEELNDYMTFNSSFIQTIFDMNKTFELGTMELYSTVKVLLFTFVQGEIETKYIVRYLPQ